MARRSERDDLALVPVVERARRHQLATSVSLAAYFGGKAVENVIADIGLYALIGAAALVIAVAGVIIIRRRRGARTGAPPPPA